jgi:hypothetical protein
MGDDLSECGELSRMSRTRSTMRPEIVRTSWYAGKKVQAANDAWSGDALVHLDELEPTQEASLAVASTTFGGTSP